MATDRLSPIIADAVDKLRSTAAASGYFSNTLTYEPKSNPGPEMTFATWIGQIRPAALVSGLDATAARLPMMCRIYLPMLADPQDTIDTRLAQASSYLLTQLTGAFTVAGAWIDLLGAHGDGLGTDLGYVELDDAMFRIADTLVPFICPDVFDQEA
jgi:hypothetical protein